MCASTMTSTTDLNTLCAKKLKAVMVGRPYHSVSTAKNIVVLISSDKMTYKAIIGHQAVKSVRLTYLTCYTHILVAVFSLQRRKIDSR